MARQREWLPWYRTKGYKGDLTELEKRQLDAFRSQETHPATRRSALPPEVSSYLFQLDNELYREKRDRIEGETGLLTAFAAVAWMLHREGDPIAADYIGAVLTIAAIWVFQGLRLTKIRTSWGTSDPIDEGIIAVWERRFVIESRRENKASADAARSPRPRSPMSSGGPN